MTEYLSLKLYKAQFVPKLDGDDFQDRDDMCKILIPMLDDNDTRGLFLSDEAAFYLYGLVNKHNIRHGCETNPRITIESVMKSPKLNI